MFGRDLFSRPLLCVCVCVVRDMSVLLPIACDVKAPHRTVFSDMERKRGGRYTYTHTLAHWHRSTNTHTPLIDCESTDSEQKCQLSCQKTSSNLWHCFNFCLLNQCYSSFVLFIITIATQPPPPPHFHLHAHTCHGLNAAWMILLCNLSDLSGVWFFSANCFKRMS